MEAATGGPLPKGTRALVPIDPYCSYTITDSQIKRAGLNPDHFRPGFLADLNNPTIPGRGLK